MRRGIMYIRDEALRCIPAEVLCCIRDKSDRAEVSRILRSHGATLRGEGICYRKTRVECTTKWCLNWVRRRVRKSHVSEIARHCWKEASRMRFLKKKNLSRNDSGDRHTYGMLHAEGASSASEEKEHIHGLDTVNRGIRHGESRTGTVSEKETV